MAYRRSPSSFALALSLLLAACSSDDSTTGASSTGESDSTTGSTAGTTTDTASSGETLTTDGTTGTASTTSSTTDTGSTSVGATESSTDPSAGGVCGDGVVDVGEECDDGNASNNDACVEGCVPASCGDGFLEEGVEKCDDGNDIDNDDCPNNCASASCGDGVVDPGEECDDGNMNDADGCTNQCKSAACGDGKVQDGEECDDGNMTDDDACSNACLAATCMDKAQNGGESDVDCGGPCTPCGLGEACNGDADCDTMTCEAGVCASALTLPECADQNVDAVMLHAQVIAMKCGAGCHLGNSQSGGLNMKDAAALKANTVNVASSQASLDRIEPSVPDQSYLLYKILGQQAKAPGGGGSTMPLGGSLTDAQKCMVINWVKGGAK